LAPYSASDWDKRLRKLLIRTTGGRKQYIRQHIPEYSDATQREAEMVS
jgi:hypothetical protein